MARKTEIKIESLEYIKSRVGVKEDREDALFCGSFGHYDTNATTWYSIFELDDFDINWTKDVKLKPAEKLFRYSTDKTRIFQIQPLVKINFDNKMAYFLTDKAHQSGEIEFQKRGSKLRYITIPLQVVDAVIQNKLNQ